MSLRNERVRKTLMKEIADIIQRERRQTVLPVHLEITKRKRRTGQYRQRQIIPPMLILYKLPPQVFGRHQFLCLLVIPRQTDGIGTDTLLFVIKEISGYTEIAGTGLPWIPPQRRKMPDRSRVVIRTGTFYQPTDNRRILCVTQNKPHRIMQPRQDGKGSERAESDMLACHILDIG